MVLNMKFIALGVGNTKNSKLYDKPTELNLTNDDEYEIDFFIHPKTLDVLFVLTVITQKDFDLEENDYLLGFIDKDSILKISCLDTHKENSITKMALREYLNEFIWYLENKILTGYESEFNLTDKSRNEYLLLDEYPKYGYDLLGNTGVISDHLSKLTKELYGTKFDRLKKSGLINLASN